MIPSARLILALFVAPAVPGVVLVVASLGSYESVLPLARALLWYGYIAAFLVAAPMLIVFRRQFSRKPVAVIPFAGAIGALAAGTPFVAAIYGGTTAADWPSFLALVPLLGIGAMFGLLSGLVFWLIARSTARPISGE
jgi:hypothetical protein